jgi:hypothetical protein
MNYYQQQVPTRNDPRHDNIGTSTTQQQQQHEQRETAGRGNDRGWQGGRMMTTHEQGGPNDDHVVWALGKFFLFVSCFYQLTNYISLIFRI